jgi:phosphate transport system permease protein
MALQSRTKDKLFEGGLRSLAIGLMILILSACLTLAWKSMPAFQEFGIGFLFSSSWNPVEEQYGALPVIIGTLLTSFLALLISLPFSVAIAIFLGEFHPKGRLSSVFTSLVELLAGIPSVIYGFWALFYMVPLIGKLGTALGFAGPGLGIMAASCVLAIMIIPFTASMAREVITMVPSGAKESAYALGATRFEVIKDIVLPYAKSGIFAGVILSLGRALGETMAVTMVIGNLNEVPKNIFGPGNTMASLIANEFNEATSIVHFSSLIAIGFVLFVITLLINILGKSIIRRSELAK